MILLYWKGAEGATRDELLGWIIGEAESATSAQRRNFNTGWMNAIRFKIPANESSSPRKASARLTGKS